MARFKVTVSYDGTAYVGWQRQPSGTSIQQLLEDALRELDGKDVTVVAAGRTDAGVHALAQPVAFTLAREIDPGTLVRALNVRLPPAVRALEASPVAAEFHPQFDASAKLYRYRIWNQPVLDPFERAYAWHIPAPILDAAAMARAARLVEGRHDFAAFRGTGTNVRTTERAVFSSVVERVGGGPLVTYEIRGNGFLRHMVRNIVGTLVEIGRGKREPEWMSEVLGSGDRAVAGRTAPPEGLFLVRVEYEPRLIMGGDVA